MNALCFLVTRRSTFDPPGYPNLTFENYAPGFIAGRIGGTHHFSPWQPLRSTLPLSSSCSIPPSARRRNCVEILQRLRPLCLWARSKHPIRHPPGCFLAGMDAIIPQTTFRSLQDFLPCRGSHPSYRGPRPDFQYHSSCVSTSHIPLRYQIYVTQTLLKSVRFYQGCFLFTLSNRCRYSVFH